VNISFSTVWDSLIDFTKNPRWDFLRSNKSLEGEILEDEILEDKPLVSESLEQNFLENPAKVFLYLLGIDLVLMFFLSAVLSFAGVEEMEHEVMKLLDDPFKLALMAVIAAPIFEEAIFRLPIGPWFGRFFKIAFWVFTIGFAAIHLTNFTDSVPLYLAPLLVLPQFLLGIILGYIRSGWGIFYAVLFHAIHNGILVSLATLGTAAGYS
jgi:hypothetical protein